MSSLDQNLRELIVRKKQENPCMSHKNIAKSLKVGKSTVTYVLKKFSETLSIDRKSGSGRPKGFISQKNVNAVVNAFKKNPGLSVRDVAKKVQVSPSFVQKVRKEKGFHSFKVNPAPNRNDKQNKEAKTRARKLYDNVIHNFDCIIMDDETYVKADFKQIPGRQFYTAKKRGDVDNKYKEKKIDKFPKKHLVWQAIWKKEFKTEWQKATNTVTKEDVQHLMAGIKAKLRKFAYAATN